MKFAPLVLFVLFIPGCFTGIVDHYVNSRFLLPSASPNQHSIELQNLQSYGTYIIYDNNKRVGVFGNNDSHLEKQSKMIWNVDEGTIV